MERTTGNEADVTTNLSPEEEPPQQATCRNCGAPLGGCFCSSCGQQDAELNQPLREVLGTFLETFIAFDAKILRTLVPLVIRPGFLTLEYFAGRRARYVPPFKLYLFLSCLMFVILGLLDYRMVSVTSDGEEQNLARAPIHFTMGAAEEAEDDSRSGEETTPAAETGEPAESGPGRGFARLMQRAFEDPQALNDGMFRHLPKVLFLLVPVGALLLKLLYRRSPHLFVRHLILSLHLHAMMFLLLVVVAILARLAHLQEKQIANILLLMFLAYTFMALRRIFEQGRFKTFVKLMLLCCCYLGATLIGMLSTLVALVLLRTPA